MHVYCRGEIIKSGSDDSDLMQFITEKSSSSPCVGKI